MRKPIHLRLPEELLTAVDVRATALGWSRTAVVERALEAALGHHEGEAGGSPLHGPPVDDGRPSVDRPVSPRASEPKATKPAPSMADVDPILKQLPPLCNTCRHHGPPRNGRPCPSCGYQGPEGFEQRMNRLRDGETP